MAYTTKSRVSERSAIPYYGRQADKVEAGSVPLTRKAQAVGSEGHAVHRLGDGMADIGGPFLNRKIEIGIGTPLTIKRFQTGITEAVEDFNVVVLPTGFRSIVDSLNNAYDTNNAALALGSVVGGLSDSNLNALGAQFINMTKPTSPAVDLATSMAEFLSERRFFALPGRAGGVEGEYLNYMFGIAPLISDARDLRAAIENKDKILAQFRANRGKPIRRRANLPSEVTTDVVTLTGRNPTFYGPSPTSRCFGAGKCVITTVTTRKMWFSGAFVYHYPDEGFGKTLAELDILYGVKPGVDTAWELLPFSWLLDYKLSTGAAISNMASFGDGLVLKYGYVMCETDQTTTYSWTGPINNASGARAETTVNAFVKSTCQQRVGANPFGFGVSPGSLNARQKSILAALGISLVRNR